MVLVVEELRLLAMNNHRGQPKEARSGSLLSLLKNVLLLIQRVTVHREVLQSFYLVQMLLCSRRMKTPEVITNQGFPLFVYQTP